MSDSAPSTPRVSLCRLALMAANSELRLTVRVHSERQRMRVLHGLSERAAAAVAEGHVKDLVSVHREGPWLRLHASSLESLARAQAAIISAITEANVSAEERAEQFDHHRGEWAPVDLPLLSEIDAEQIRIHEGPGQWGAVAEPNRLTIHFELGARHEAAELADRLLSRGYDVQRHWTYVYAFVDDRDAADQLLEELGDDRPEHAHIFVMGEGRTFFL